MRVSDRGRNAFSLAESQMDGKTHTHTSPLANTFPEPINIGSDKSPSFPHSLALVVE